MNTAFCFQVDPSRNLVRIVMSGLLSLDDVRNFAQGRREAHAKLRCPRNEHVTLNDIRALKIQPQPVVTAFREMLAAPEYRSRRLAFVVGRTLALNQLQRALADREGRAFEDPVAAEAWLLRAECREPPALRSSEG
jgi:hypothetical protein